MTQAMKDSDREVVRLDDDDDGFAVLKQGLPNVGGITSYSGASILSAYSSLGKTSTLFTPERMAFQTGVICACSG